jgi:hypothetical protein
MMRFDALSSHPTAVYNTGGWVVDRPHAQILFGGAVVMFDEELNGVSLRMYNEAAERAEFVVRISTASDESSRTNPLAEHIRQVMNPERPPWSDFSRAAAEAVATHTNKLAKLLASGSKTRLHA